MVETAGPGGLRPCLKGPAATQIQLRLATEDFSPVLRLADFFFPGEAINLAYYVKTLNF